MNSKFGIFSPNPAAKQFLLYIPNYTIFTFLIKKTFECIYICLYLFKYFYNNRFGVICL